MQRTTKFKLGLFVSLVLVLAFTLDYWTFEVLGLAGLTNLNRNANVKETNPSTYLS